MKNSLKRRITATFYTLFATLAIGIGNISASAADADPTAKTVSWLKKWQNWSKEIGWAVAGVCIVVAAIIFMIPSEEQHRNAKKVAIYVLVGATLLTAGPAIITAMKQI